jgi:protein arginine N-methyltransferase 2
MKNDEVIITDDYIVLKENTRSVVMAKGAKSITEIYSHVVCQNGGDVLDVGFGMGFSANKMSELADTYTCIEINPQIYERALEWAKDKPNVEILFGNWIDIIPTLDKKFDGIFFDTHNDANSHLAEEYAKLISKEGTIFSHWNYFEIRDIQKLNIYKCIVDPNSMPKLVNNIHNVNWTYFTNGEFKKGNNKINFHGGTKII